MTADEEQHFKQRSTDRTALPIRNDTAKHVIQKPKRACDALYSNICNLHVFYVFLYYFELAFIVMYVKRRLSLSADCPE